MSPLPFFHLKQKQKQNPPFQIELLRRFLTSMSSGQSKGNKSNICGAVLADKPEGMASSKMVSLLRREMGLRKIGHTGILDRAASGLMILLVGRATGLAQFFLKTDKEYSADFYFGKSTDTHDREGQTIEEISKEESSSFLQENRKKIENYVSAWLELQEQAPPIYSALKQNGKRLSDHVRAGRVVKTEMRPARIYESRLLEYLPEKALFRVHLRVSGGTYVRSLARDLGDDMGIPVHLGALRRMGVGPHKLTSSSWQPGENKPALLPIQKILPSWPRLRTASPAHVEKIMRGIFLPLQYLEGEAPKRVHQNFFIEDQEERALAWAVRASGGYRYRRVLA